MTDGPSGVPAADRGPTSGLSKSGTTRLFDTNGDRRLLELAAPRPEPLFAVLRRAATLRPLLFLAATLPGLLVLSECVPDTRSSLWALRALDVLGTADFEDVIRPGQGGASQSLLFQPPLQAWLVAGSMQTIGAARRMSPFFPSYLWSALTVWCLYRLVSRFAGHRLAFIAALGFCAHPQVMLQIRSASPDSLATLLACLTAWLFLRHLQIPYGFVSWSLLGAGVAWGFCLLAAGPLAIVLAVILLIHAIAFPWVRLRTTEAPLAGRSHRNQPGRQFRSWVLLLVTGIPFASWWLLMMSEHYGWYFQYGWWTGLPTTPPGRQTSLYLAESVASVRGHFQDWLGLQAWIAGWALLGFWKIGSDWRGAGHDSRRELHHLALIWAVLAVALRTWIAGVSRALPLSVAIAEPLTIIPLLILAAVGIEAVLDRKAPTWGVAAAISMTVGLASLGMTTSWWLVAAVGLATFAGIMLVAALVTRPFSNDRPWQEPQVRPVLVGVLVCFLAGQVVECVRTASAWVPGSERIPKFRQKLRDVPDIRRISVISPQSPPPVQLRLLLRSIWPAAEFAVTEGWDPGLAQHLKSAVVGDESRYLVVEWTRRELNIPAETGSGWEVRQVVDPVRSYGRRLSAHLISPTQQYLDQIARSSRAN